MFCLLQYDILCVFCLATCHYEHQKWNLGPIDANRSFTIDLNRTRISLLSGNISNLILYLELRFFFFFWVVVHINSNLGARLESLKWQCLGGWPVLCMTLLLPTAEETKDGTTTTHAWFFLITCCCKTESYGILVPCLARNQLVCKVFNFCS